MIRSRLPVESGFTNILRFAQDDNEDNGLRGISLDIYHIWCDLKTGVLDTDFTDAANEFLGNLKQSGGLATYRITRRKLGLGIAGLGEFHIQLEFLSLGELDEVFQQVSSRSDPVESFHHAVNSKVVNVQFSLYRDFPDEHRRTGEEKF